MSKVLAIKDRRLGDTAIWTSALEALCNLSFTSIDIAYPAEYSTLFDSDPRFENRYLLTPHISDSWATLQKIRKNSYDAVLNFHASNHTAYFTMLTKGDKKLIHSHSRASRHSRYSKSIPQLGQPMSAIERDLNVVRALGWSGKSPKTRLIATAKAKDKGHQLLEPYLKQSSRKKIAFSVSASRPSKQWPLENFISLAKSLAEEVQVFVLYDAEPKSALWKNMKQEATPLHTPDLESLMGCLSQMNCFMGADSGVKHVAAALGIPTVTVFGPESIGEWHGYESDHHKSLQFPVSCRDQNPEDPYYAWCGREICPLASHACLSQILPQRVLTEIRSLQVGA